MECEEVRPMILESLRIDPLDFERRTGWALKPEGACKGDRCVPLPAGADRFDARTLADRLGMPIVGDEATGLWSLGPEAGERALASAEAPDFTLPDPEGRPFRLSSLRGTKTVLVAWASW
jgi:hypothetical protein